MAQQLLTLIGSGEVSDRMLNLYSTLFSQLDESPRLAFLDTPAAFQLNRAELGEIFAAYFKKHFAHDLAVVQFARADDPQVAVRAVEQLARANVILAGPGSPTFAVRQWQGTVVWQTITQRFAEGAQIIFASAATVALGKWALPVYEIYKVGETPHWENGLDLLSSRHLELAVIPHYNNSEGRTYDTRYCFMGEPRLRQLEAALPPTAVILGIDENTACTVNLTLNQISVTGAGHVTIRFNGEERQYAAATTFPLNRLTPAHALSPVVAPTPAAQRPPTTAHDVVPAIVQQWATERETLRAEKKFSQADALRDRIAGVGFLLKDSPDGAQLSLQQYASSGAVPSRLESPPTRDWSVVLLTSPGGNEAPEVLRAAESALHWGQEHDIEIIIVDNAMPGAAALITHFAAQQPAGKVVPISMAENLGEGAGRNAGLRSCHGKHVMILGGHMELAGDVFAPLASALANAKVGATGSHGLVSADLFNFEPAPTAECDAIEFYLFAFRRDILNQAPLLDEKFEFYRNIDLDWSMAIKDVGFRLVTTPGLSLTVHPHPYLRMDADERDKLSKKNYRRFLKKWRNRHDLLVTSQS